MKTRNTADACHPSDALGLTYLLISGVGVVFMPITAKFSLLSGSDVYTIAFIRGLVASAILLTIVLLTRQSLALPRHLWRDSLVVGLSSTAFVYGIVGAIVTINISLALLIVYLYPMGVAIWEHTSGVAKLNAGQWICGVIVCVGLVLILGVDFEQINLAGVVLATLAMIAAVVITLVNHRLTATQGPFSSNLYMSLWGIPFFGIGLLISGEFLEPGSVKGWMGLFGNGIAYCVAWVGFFAAARILGATRASVISLSEPVVAGLFAWLLFNETFSLLQWLGFFVVLSALLVFEVLARKQ
ncbi:MAG: EamA family transporter [Pseudomonadota bacterium]